jgi:Uma2 family endonuclease
MTTAVRIPPNRVLLTGVSWSTYQSLITDIERVSGKRLTYDRGTLEILMPLPPHETHKKLLGRFVEVVTEALGIEIRSLGSTTWSREDLARGLEADECYYIQHEPEVRGKSTIDLSVDPPPDLAIEVDITSSSLDRLSIYASLGVAEIWRYDGDVVRIYSLVDGNYEAQEISTVLPLLSSEILMRFLRMSASMGETSLVRLVRQWVQAQT